MKNIFQYSIYFLRGYDSKGYIDLNIQQQYAIKNFIDKDPQGYSFLVFNHSQLQQKIDYWNTYLPYIQPYYAVKSNPLPLMLNNIQKAFNKYDCASKQEIEIVLQQGTPVENIIFSNSIKCQSDILYAKQVGIKLTTADTYKELEILQNLYPEIEILWRISTPNQVNNDPYFCDLSEKFGDDIRSDLQIKTRMMDIRDMGINLKGIHFHCGSGIDGAQSFEQAIKLSQKCIEIGREVGHRMDILDIGGGLPDHQISIETLKELRKVKEIQNIQVIAEPGRYFSSNCFYILYRVIGKRVKDNLKCYHVNESIFHSFNSVMGRYHSFDGDENQLYSIINMKVSKEYHQCSLAGMTCCSKDFIAKKILLPELEVDDWICMSGVGAYTIGPNSYFNGMQSISRIEQL